MNPPDETPETEYGRIVAACAMINISFAMQMIIIIEILINILAVLCVAAR